MRTSGDVRAVHGLGQEEWMNRTKWIVVALAGLGSLCCLAAAALVGVGYLASNVATPDPAPAVEHPLSAQQVTVHADRVITETAISAISLARIDAKPEEIAVSEDLRHVMVVA